MATSDRLILASVIVVIWACITLFGMLYQTGRGSLADLVSHHIALAIPAAGVFLLLCIAIFRWDDLGLNAPRPPSSIKLLWPYAIFVVGMGALAFSAQPIAPHFLLIVMMNTAFVGFSEELAFRGILWGAVRKAMPFWPGVFLVSAAFGAVHIFNAMITGQLDEAGVQAFNAFISGLGFLAVRIRTKSVVPVMIAHWFWDMVLFLVSAGLATGKPTQTGSPSMAGLLVVAPIALYGLWLLRKPADRHITDDWQPR